MVYLSCHGISSRDNSKARETERILKLFDIFAVKHATGHQDDKMNGYSIICSSLSFALDKDYKKRVNIWCPVEVQNYVSGVTNTISPHNELWTKLNKKGEKRYVRHTGLRCVKELCDAGLVKYEILTLEEANKVIKGLKKAAVLLKK